VLAQLPAAERAKGTGGRVGCWVLSVQEWLHTAECAGSTKGQEDVSPCQEQEWPKAACGPYTANKWRSAAGAWLAYC